MTRQWALAWFWRLVPALFVAVPLVVATVGSPEGALAGVALVVLLGTMLVAAGHLPVVGRRTPAPCVVRRAATHLPSPLAVAVPHVPTAPRAPGRG